jgi:hypothetical protein
MINTLSGDEFQATFVEPMKRLGEDESFRPIPHKGYLTECIAELALFTSIEDIEIQHVYLNGNKSYTHVMFWYGEPNVYLVIVVDHSNDSVHGHHFLDLNEKYRLK